MCLALDGAPIVVVRPEDPAPIVLGRSIAQGLGRLVRGCWVDSGDAAILWSPVLAGNGSGIAEDSDLRLAARDRDVVS